ncbi:MAG: EAL domain-containing protein [Actinomycetales bacterium]|nr:EAL domain-containing protein [Actinomycetales bacterium]
MRSDYRPGLSEPRDPVRGDAAIPLVVGVLFTLLVVLVYAFGHEPLLAVPAMATAHAVAMVIIYATTAAMVVTYARATGEVGYLVLAGTFMYAGGVMAIFVTAYPNAILQTDPPTILWGTRDSAVALFHLWQLAVIIGLPIATVIIARDYRRGRPPMLGRGVPITVAAVTAALVATALAVGPAGGLLPSLVKGIEATPVSKALFWVEMLLALVGTFVVAVEARRRSAIARWMLAVMVITWGGAVASLAADRYSLAWYYNRVVGLVAALVLLLILIRDIGRVERETLSLLGRDALTSAASREALLIALERHVRRSRHLGVPVTVVWIDIDDFKDLNDHYGEQVGDAILIEVAARIRALLGPGDIIGRSGGDDFIVVAVGRNVEQSETLAESMLAAIHQPCNPAGTSVSVTASLGLAGGTVVGGSPEVLIRQAMLALLAAEQAGGDRVESYTEELGVQAAERSRMRHDLGRAIRDDEFVLAFQPIVDLRTGAVAGAETLVRWRRDGAFVPAGEFIGFAAETGMIVGVGRRVIEALEGQAPALLEAVPAPFFLSFNLSARELADDQIVERLIDGPLRARGHRLVIEVTEEFELTAYAPAEDNLQRLRSAGYRVAVDDFGAGFSNLSSLTRLQPAIVKIDRSIVVRAGIQERGSMAALAAAADIARALGALVLAEGLESNDEAEACIRLDIDLAQGYRFARSLDEGDLLAFCASRSVAADGSLGRGRQLSRDDAIG